MKRSRSLYGVFVGLLVTATSLSAHHSFALFDMEKDAEYVGVITTWKWQNPHVHFIVNVKPGSNVNPESVGTWDVEAASVNILSKQGWTRATYKPGDPVRLVGHPMKDGTKGISLFYVVMPDGTRMYSDVARPRK